MQKLMMMLVICLGAGFTMCAQKTPPAAVQEAFKQQFPQIKEVKWEHEKSGDWEAEFEESDVEMSANFTVAGQWIETETELKVADLPASVQTALQGKKVKEAAKILRADGTTVYEAEVSGKDLIFDAEGKKLN